MPTNESSVIGGGNSFVHRGKTYLLGKVALTELRELETYLRREPLEAIAPMLKDLDPTSRQDLIAGALALGDKRKIGTEEFNSLVQTLNGTLYLLWMALRQHNATLSRKDVEVLFTEVIEDGLSDDVKARLYQASGFDPVVKKEVGEQKKSPRKPRNR